MPRVTMSHSCNVNSGAPETFEFSRKSHLNVSLAMLASSVELMPFILLLRQKSLMSCCCHVKLLR